ncbi:hypothetical protein C8R44DRAFT_911203 [Mycena epipterygia]|nr:hypothetical protein C8R44DRAFT_911203 [Mycena epipterygia]
MTPAELVNFESDDSDDSDEDSSGSDADDELETDPVPSTSSSRLPAAPPRKRRKLDIPVREMRKMARQKKSKELQKALDDIQKLIRSNKTVFVAGRNGLQSYRARAIQSYLLMVVKNGRLEVEASEKAAESQGFAARWGGRNVRSWTRRWIRDRELPVSRKGSHGKVYSLLDNPSIKAELHTYVRSNKWAMDPKKLAEFSSGKLIPEAAKKYAQDVIRDEMPRGLKKYMEAELLPRLQLQVRKGISLSTARRWLHKEGFQYIGHKKDANDTTAKSWVLENQHKLRKKGVGRGLHRSDIICSTVGHLVEGGETLEYGKNYDGYWDGEKFVKQLQKKLIPAFERIHGPGYQALFMVDHSQGHAAYAPDALLVSRMNTKPGGKQARLRDGWYIKNGEKITQSMIFPRNHCEYPNQPKGIKARYLREHSDYTFETLKENLPKALASVPIATIRRWEHRMYRWMDAYRAGMGTQDAQLHVRKFGSREYKSHRRIPNRVAEAFDQ